MTSPRGTLPSTVHVLLRDYEIRIHWQMMFNLFIQFREDYSLSIVWLRKEKACALGAASWCIRIGGRFCVVSLLCLF